MTTAGQAFKHEERIRGYIKGYRGDMLCARQVWYEALEGCGIPDDEDISFISRVLESTDGWTDVGVQRYEKFGRQPSYSRKIIPEDCFDDGGHIRVQHMFKVGSMYQVPDGKVYKIVLCEVYNLRGFEIERGKLVGSMIRIDPTSELAKSLVPYPG